MENIDKQDVNTESKHKQQDPLFYTRLFNKPFHPVFWTGKVKEGTMDRIDQLLLKGAKETIERLEGRGTVNEVYQNSSDQIYRNFLWSKK